MSSPHGTFDNSLCAERTTDHTASAGRRKTRWGTTVLGVVLLAEGLGKAAAPAGYFAALGRFRLLPDRAVAAVGTIWILLELLCGLGLLAAGLARIPRRGIALPAAVGALALQLAYATLSTQAYARGLHIENCTCFGVYLAQHLSWFVLLQDAYMISYASWQVKKIHRWQCCARR